MSYIAYHGFKRYWNACNDMSEYPPKRNKYDCITVRKNSVFLKLTKEIQLIQNDKSPLLISHADGKHIVITLTK